MAFDPRARNQFGKDEYYTPTWVFDSLLRGMKPGIVQYLKEKGTVWESACGNGNLMRHIRKNGFKTIGSDMTPLAGGDPRGGHDFLKYQPHTFDIQVTNPPFSIKTEWIERSIKLGKPFCLLLPVNAMGGVGRMKLLKNYPLGIINVGRVRFENVDGVPYNGAPFDVAWFCTRELLRGPILFEHKAKTVKDVKKTA